MTDPDNQVAGCGSKTNEQSKTDPAKVKAVKR